MKVLKRIVFFYFLIGFSHASNAQVFDPELAVKLQAKLDSLRTYYTVKGISAGVLLPGQGLWKGTSGVSYGSEQIRSDMQFGIASNTKLFTAVTLLKLAEKNIINIDDSLHKWLPPFKNIDSNVTIRQLLNHTSGLADYNSIAGYPDSIMKDPNRIFTTDELVRWVGPPLFPAGKGWEYTNTNYLLAGMIAESATGKNIAQLIRESVLNPLQLDSTFFDVKETIKGTIAQPWQIGVNIGSIPRKSLNSAAYCGGAMYSNAGDMVQWYRRLMGGQLLNSGSYKEMTTFVGSGNYGFGIALSNLAGRPCFTHGGSIRGYSSFMAYDTTFKAVICVLMNSNPAPARLVAEQLLQVISGSTAGVQNVSDIDFQLGIYPNPTGETLYFNTLYDQTVQYRITNSFGQTIQQGNLSGNTLDVSYLPNGLYFIRIADAKGAVFYSKLTKE